MGSRYAAVASLLPSVMLTQFNRRSCPLLRRFVDFFAPFNPDPLAADVLQKILTFEPDERPTVEELLQHPYFANLHCEEDEPSGYSLPPEAFAFEEGDCSPETLRDAIIDEILVHAALAEEEEEGGDWEAAGDLHAEEKTSRESSEGRDLFEGSKATVEKPHWMEDMEDEDVDVLSRAIAQAARKFGGADVIEEAVVEEIASSNGLSPEQVEEAIGWIYNRA